MTEQATVYEMSEAECRRVARRGPPYNPYRAQQERQMVQQQQGQQGAQQQPQGGTAAAVQGSVIGGGQMAAYGDIGVAPRQKIYGSM